MSLDQFELLELRRDGTVQTYHGREIATARPVQVHLFVAGNTPEAAEMLALINRLPDAERRRIIDRGEARGLPYLVTDRLAGYANLSEWLSANSSAPAPVRPAPARVRPASVDEQFMALFDTPPAPSPVMPGPAAYQAPHAAAATAPAREPEPSVLGKAIEIEAYQPKRGFFPTAAKSILWLVMGIVAALGVLGAIAAFFFFHR